MKHCLMLLAVVLCACGGGGGGGTEPGPAPGTVQFSPGSYVVDEEDGTVTVTVTRSGGSKGAVGVTYSSVDGSAQSGADYSAVSGRLRWADGDSAPRSFGVPVIEDQLREGEESFQMSLSSPGGGVGLGAATTATLVIRDNEPPSAGQLQFGSGSFSVLEDAGSVVIPVMRSGGGDGPASVSYASSDGTALAGSDYTAVSGTLHWAAGDSATQGIVVPIADDARIDGDKTLHLNLSSVNGATLGPQRGTTLTVLDNEAARPGHVAFTHISYTAAENAAAALITVSRSGGSDGPVSVGYATANGTAQAGADYAAASGRLDWPSGDASPRSFSVPLLDDAQREGDETLQLSLSAPAGGATVGAGASLVIRDNELPMSGQLQFSASGYAAGEAASSVTVTVTRSGGSDGRVSVSYASADDAAVAAIDYQAAAGTLVWESGDSSSKSFRVELLDDLDAEGEETVALSLAEPTGGAALGTPRSASLTIEDDDPELRINTFENLVFDNPVFMTTAPGDATRLYLLERSGRIRVFANEPAAATAGTFLDLTDRVSSSDIEQGLLGLAFDPQFTENGRFYVNYVADDPRRTVVSRFTATSRDAADAASELPLLSIPRSSVHNGGWLGFGPDGKLYISSGDSGTPGNGQRLDVLEGKLLRINRDGTVPADNPFVAIAGARPEIWAYGFRNPWRASFDRDTGRLWLGDVGEFSREEIDLVERGGNYGWSLCEGSLCSGTPQQHRLPLFEYDHDDQGGSITGGYVYRGAALPEFEGLYLYADFISGAVWGLRLDGNTAVLNDQIATVSYPSSLAEDAAGELYLLGFFDGRVHRIERR